MKITEYRKQPGVEDLPFKVGSHFAMALKKEDKGDHEGAEESLAKAVAAEEAESNN